MTARPISEFRAKYYDPSIIPRWPMVTQQPSLKGKGFSAWVRLLAEPSGIFIIDSVRSL